MATTETETVCEVLKSIEDRVRSTTPGGLSRRAYLERIAEALDWGPWAVRYQTETPGARPPRPRALRAWMDAAGATLDEERRLRRALLPPRGRGA